MGSPFELDPAGVDLANRISQELRKAGLPSRGEEVTGGDGGFATGVGRAGDDLPVTVSWIASHTLHKEASRALMRLLSDHDPRPPEQRLDELFSSSPYAYRDQVRRIMATAIHEILLAAGFDTTATPLRVRSAGAATR